MCRGVPGGGCGREKDADGFLADKTAVAEQVFPASADGSLVPPLSAFAVFAVGFFLRPGGGLLMGAVADRHGRRTALTVTILLMGGSGLPVGLTPTYATAGMSAPVLLVLARLLQGLSVGGEFAASTTLLVESAAPGRRGVFSSFQSSVVYLRLPETAHTELRR